MLISLSKNAACSQLWCSYMLRVVWSGCGCNSNKPRSTSGLKKKKKKTLSMESLSTELNGAEVILSLDPILAILYLLKPQIEY